MPASAPPNFKGLFAVESIEYLKTTCATAPALLNIFAHA